MDDSRRLLSLLSWIWIGYTVTIFPPIEAATLLVLFAALK